MGIPFNIYIVETKTVRKAAFLIFFLLLFLKPLKTILKFKNICLDCMINYCTEFPQNSVLKYSYTLKSILIIKFRMDKNYKFLAFLDNSTPLQCVYYRRVIIIYQLLHLIIHSFIKASHPICE